MLVIPDFTPIAEPISDFELRFFVRDRLLESLSGKNVSVSVSSLTAFKKLYTAYDACGLEIEVLFCGRSLERVRLSLESGQPFAETLDGAHRAVATSWINTLDYLNALKD